MLPAGGARTISALQLESGGDGLTGRFGDGAGMWRLSVSAGVPIRVMSLLESPAGHLSNLSSSPRTATTWPPAPLTAWIASPRLIGNFFLTTEVDVDVVVRVGDSVVSAELVNDRVPGERVSAPVDGAVVFDDVPLAIGENAMTITVRDRLDAAADLNLTTIRTRLVSFDSALDLSETAVATGWPDRVTARIALTDRIPGEAIEVDLVRVDASGTVLAALAALADDGNVANGDDVPGDGVFSGKFAVDTATEGEFLLRVRARRGGGTDFSEVVVFSVVEPFTDAEIAAATAAIDAAVGTEEAKGTVDLTAPELRNAKDNIVRELAGIEGVRSSRLTPDGRMILAEFENGLNYALLFVEEDASGEPVRHATGAGSRRDPGAPAAPIPGLDFYVDAGAKPSPFRRAGRRGAASAASGSDVAEDVIGASTALLLGPFEFEFGPSDETNLVHPSIRASTTPSFNPVHREVNHEVTVEDFKRFDDHGVSILSSHGGVSSGTVFVATGQEATEALKKQYKNDILTNRLWVGQSVNVRRTGFWSILWATKTADTFYVTPDFIRHYNRDIPNSLVVMSICKGLANGSMSSALLAGGAGAFLSFTDTVASGFAGASVRFFIDRMIAGDTVREALIKTHGTVGPDDGDGTPASLRFHGNGGLKLEGIGLLNGSFERNLLHWVGNGGDIRILTRLSDVRPWDGSRFVVLSSGLGSIGNSQAILRQSFVVPADASTLRFSYNVLSEEPDEYVGTEYDDQFEAHLYTGDAYSTSHLLAQESVNGSTWTKISGVDEDGGLFPGGDGTAYQTGPKNVDFDVRPFRGQRVRLRFRVFDRGDSKYDTAAVIDDVRLD